MRDVDRTLARTARLVRLAATMLRYRVAVMLWMFMLLGAARHGLTVIPVDDLLALTVALAASYVAATTVNDVADAEIDRVNHPEGRGRPLVQGTATPGDLWVLNVVAALVALAAGAFVGWRGVAVVAVSLLIGYAYSMRPLLLSYRPYSAAPVLAVAYVVAPYLHGLALVEATPGREDALFVGALYVLFVSRIVLKDFRDRVGDAMFGRRTFLLRHGKRATCATSAAALVAGIALLLASLPRDPALTTAVVVLGGAVAAQLRTLSATEDAHAEQVAIGTAARAGNGLLVLVLAGLLLDAQQASALDRSLLLSVLLGLYLAGYVVLARRPDEVLIGYKG